VHDLAVKTSPEGLRAPLRVSGPRVSVVFRPNAGLLTQTRAFVSSFCGTFVRDADIVYRVTIAVHELLENVIKYSADGATDLTIELCDDDAESRIAIRVENRAAPNHLASARSAIDRIHRAVDPFELYCQMVQASATREGSSGLGLVRICAEAECALDYAIVGDRLALSAHAFVGRRGIA
jgi:hypothetical protein